MAISEFDQLAKAENIVRGGDPCVLVEDMIRSAGVSRNLLIKRLADFRPALERLSQPDGVEALATPGAVKRVLDYLVWLTVEG